MEFVGVLYHVTYRGNERKAIFTEEDDFAMFLSLLGDVCTRFNGVIHA